LVLGNANNHEAQCKDPKWLLELDVPVDRQADIEWLLRKGEQGTVSGVNYFFPVNDN
jgi:hypothetical protein